MSVGEDQEIKEYEMQEGRAGKISPYFALSCYLFSLARLTSSHVKKEEAV